MERDCSFLWGNTNPSCDPNAIQDWFGKIQTALRDATNINQVTCIMDAVDYVYNTKCKDEQFTKEFIGIPYRRIMSMARQKLQQMDVTEHDKNDGDVLFASFSRPTPHSSVDEMEKIVKEKMKENGLENLWI